MLTLVKVQWITLFSYDHETGSLVIGFTHEPGKAEPQRVARFLGAERVESRWQDRDGECLEMLLGAHEFASDSGFHYTLNTDQREIELEATNPASVHEV